MGIATEYSVVRYRCSDRSERSERSPARSCGELRSQSKTIIFLARDGNRTHYPQFTILALYQLSYSGTARTELRKTADPAPYSLRGAELRRHNYIDYNGNAPSEASLPTAGRYFGKILFPIEVIRMIINFKRKITVIFQSIISHWMDIIRLDKENFSSLRT